MESFHCEPFGLIKITRRHGARNIIIRITSCSSVSISADYYTSRKEITDLLEKNRTAIIEKQLAFKSEHRLIDGNSHISNKYFVLDIRKDMSLTKYLFALKRVHDSERQRYTLLCNDNIDFSNQDIQERLTKAINLTIRNIARPFLEKRTEELADKLGFEINSISIKTERSKWGSCSSKKNINLSSYLIFLPDHLCDYIIIHELCHLREMNHGIRFHALVNEYTEGREKELVKELKNYSLNLSDYITRSNT